MATFAQHIATLEGFATRAPLGAEAAANAMADEFKPAVQSVLLARSHAFATKTPSARGEPPAAISDALAASVMNDPAVPIGDDAYLAKSGPTTRYSRIQELGGWMEGHPLMHWREDGVQHWSAGHELPERPYVKPTLDAEVASGSLISAAVDAFAAEVYP